MNFLPLKETTEQNNVNSKDAELYLITHERGWIYNGAASLERSESILILLSRQRLAAGADENRPALMFRIGLFYTCGRENQADNTPGTTAAICYLCASIVFTPKQK